MANFTINGFSIGTDAQVTLIWQPSGTSLAAASIGHLMEVNAEQQVENIKIEPITNGGQSVNENVYTGWNGSLGFTRVNGSITAIFSTLEQNYYNGQRGHWDLQVTVRNIDGTVDEYLFENCSFTRPQFGTFRTRSAVEQTFDFVATTMEIMSGPGSLIPAVG